jgi:hypothetical protein
LIQLSILFILVAQRPGATFLLIPPAARASGMAYAWTGMALDASANYYNGAGLAFLKSPEITFDYLGYLPGLQPDMHYLYFAGVCPLVRSAWGFDIVYFTPGKIEVRNEEGVYLAECLCWRIAPKITYARKINDKLSLGIGIKYIYQKYALPWWDVLEFRYYGIGLERGGTGSSFGFDLNCLCKVLSNLQCGLVLHNIGPHIRYTDRDASDPLPATLRLGIAWCLIEKGIFKASVSAELSKILTGMFADESASFYENLKYEIKEAWKGIGMEIGFCKILRLRAGYFHDEECVRKGITFGAGFEIRNFAFDLGIDENVYEYPTQNRRLSLSYKFGG